MTTSTSQLARSGLLLLVVLSIVGCTRTWYRNSADCEVYDAIGQKTDETRWPLNRIDIIPDQSSRLYDPTNPDCPPLPPDDETWMRPIIKISTSR